MDWKYTLKLRALALIKVPLVAFIAPVVEEISEDVCVLRVPFGWRVKNHLGSMFFGALTTAADTTYGLLYFKNIEGRKTQVPATIKEFQVKFLKRVEGDTWFRCQDGAKVKALLDKAIETGERVEDWVDVRATVPSKLNDEAVAEFRLLVSMKKSSRQ
jgi:acyl-coenzyme A thioesterase PaaI-like protein